MGPVCSVKGCQESESLLMPPSGLNLAQRTQWVHLIEPDISRLAWGFDSIAVCPKHFESSDVSSRTVPHDQGSIEVKVSPMAQNVTLKEFFTSTLGTELCI